MQQKYFDLSRKKAVAATPEEAVRQSVVAYLTGALQVPPHLIETEFALCHIDGKASGRVDVVVHDFREGRSIERPWLLVECKRPGVESPEALIAQVNRYLKILAPRFIMLALGENALFLEQLPDGKGYRRIRELPPYPANG